MQERQSHSERKVVQKAVFRAGEAQDRGSKGLQDVCKLEAVEVLARHGRQQKNSNPEVGEELARSRGSQPMGKRRTSAI